MTAEELTKRLKSLPPETPVLVEGYETGFDDVVDLKAQCNLPENNRGFE